MTTPVIVGISGGSGSGKTTLAKGLCNLFTECGSLIISQDDYYRGLPDGVESSDYNFDEPSALDLDRLVEDLTALKHGMSVRRPVYDFVRHCRSEDEQETEPVPLIVVEGIFLFVLTPLSELFDLRFFADVPAEERLRRRIERDVVSRGRSEKDIREQWFRQVEPMYQKYIAPTRVCADFVLDMPTPDNLAYSEQVVAMWGMVEKMLGLKKGSIG